MKKTVLLNLFIVTVTLVTFASCHNDDDNATTTTDDNTISFSEIETLVTLHGNLDSDIVVVNTQGGPITELEDESLNEFIELSETENVLHVNVHQAQTINPDTFISSDITFKEAQIADEQSVLYLKKVVDYYKSKNKTVYILGISFGAFMTQELIADYGIDVADGYLIMVGRLDIDNVTWQEFSLGNLTVYEYDNEGNYTINKQGTPQDMESRNMSRLAAGLGFNRYTNKLKSIENLSKITYIHGDRDEQVGPLSLQEIQFLKDKGANLLLAENKNHFETVFFGLSYIKQTFNIE